MITHLTDDHGQRVPVTEVDPHDDLDAVEAIADREAVLAVRRDLHTRLRAATRRAAEAPCRCSRCGDQLPRYAMSRLGTGKDTELVCIVCLFPGGN